MQHSFQAFNHTLKLVVFRRWALDLIPKFLGKKREEKFASTWIIEYLPRRCCCILLSCLFSQSVLFTQGNSEICQTLYVRLLLKMQKLTRENCTICSNVFDALTLTCFSFSTVCKVSFNNTTSFSAAVFSSVSEVTFSCNTLFSFSTEEILSSSVDTSLSRPFLSWVKLCKVLFNPCGRRADGDPKRARWAWFKAK